MTSICMKCLQNRLVRTVCANIPNVQNMVRYCPVSLCCRVCLQDNHGYVWILTVQDHFTKYLWAEAFKTKAAPKIAAYLLSIFRDGVCFPERWHADNGGEFKKFHIDAVRALLAVNAETRDGMLLPYSHSMPRNPQCQGLVERCNRTLKTSMVKQMSSNGYVAGTHEAWQWRPYLKRQVQNLNRTVVPMYRCTHVRTARCSHIQIHSTNLYTNSGSARVC
jgi:transposase InsO family protein